MTLADYFTGYKQDVRRTGELITEITWSRLPARSVNTFRKLGRRIGDAITVTGVAVTLVVEDGVCQRARIALGAVAPVVFRATAAEAVIEGQALSAELMITPPAHPGLAAARLRREIEPCHRQSALF